MAETDDTIAQVLSRYRFDTPGRVWIEDRAYRFVGNALANNRLTINEKVWKAEVEVGSHLIMESVTPYSRLWREAEMAALELMPSWREFSAIRLRAMLGAARRKWKAAGIE